MATPIAWLLNLDADQELADPVHYRPSPEMEQRILSLSSKMSLLLRPCDLILNQNSEDEAKALCRWTLAFCPTSHARARLRALGRDLSDAPAMSILARANSRSFCAELGQTLPGAHYVTDMQTLREVLRSAPPERDFVLKRPFGFAGRERSLARGGQLDPSTLGFVERTFARGGGLQVEPWLQRVTDFALHGYLLPTGELLRGPLVRQACDRMGRWLGSELARPEWLASTHSDALLVALEDSARALHGLGYFGPFGIDAFTYVDAGGTLLFQPRSEINARFTMGYPRELLERALAAYGSRADPRASTLPLSRAKARETR
jgi:hypothetical protein